jgi:hypothetical protein
VETIESRSGVRHASRVVGSAPCQAVRAASSPRAVRRYANTRSSWIQDALHAPPSPLLAAAPDPTVNAVRFPPGTPRNTSLVVFLRDPTQLRMSRKRFPMPGRGVAGRSAMTHAVRRGRCPSARPDPHMQRQPELLGARFGRPAIVASGPLFGLDCLWSLRQAPLRAHERRPAEGACAGRSVPRLRRGGRRRRPASRRADRRGPRSAATSLAASYVGALVTLYRLPMHSAMVVDHAS